MTSLAFTCLLLGLAIGCLVGFLIASGRSATAIGELRATLTAERDVSAERLALLGADRSRESTIVDLVRPVRESLAAIAETAAAAERNRLTNTADLVAQVRTMNETSVLLGQHTHRLANALHRSGVRGQWGEMTLRRLVEVAGLMRHVHFVEQPTVRDEDQGVTLRPDMVIKLSQDRHIVIDAKVSIDALLDQANELSDGSTTAAASKHAAAMRSHIDQLASKKYWSQFDDSPEFVVMFVPAESLLGTALEADPGLLERAFTRNVVIATPATLLALLRTVAMGWRDAAMNSNAREIHGLGTELLSRLQSLSNHFAKLGSALDNAVGSYNKAMGSWESRVMVTARRMGELSGHTASEQAKTAEVVLPIERRSRQISIPSDSKAEIERTA